MAVTLITLGVLMLVLVAVTVLLGKQTKMKLEIRRNLAREWSGPKGHWFWGHLLFGKGQFFQYLKSQVPSYPFGHRVDLGPFASILRINHPDIAQKILSSSEELSPKDEKQYRALIPWLGYGLLTLGGSEWLRHRRLLTSSFHFDILRPYTTLMNQSAKVLVLKWCRATSNGEKSLEIFGDVSMLTLDSMLKCLMSFESHCQDSEKGRAHTDYILSIYKLSTFVGENIKTLNPFFLTRLTSKGREYAKACAVVHEYSSSVIQKRKQDLINGKASEKRRKYFDFLDMLLKAEGVAGQKLSDEEIRAEVDTFMFEGNDTTASAISWCLYLLAKNKHHQELCYEEIKSVFGGKEDLEWDDLSKLKHLTLCIKESLRMYPPVLGIMRQPTRDIQVAGRTIKKGTRILLSMVGVHWNPIVWPSPEEYNPYRFTEENCKERSPFAFIPFSAGPRNCIGQVFAMNEMKISVVHVLKNFLLSVDGTKTIVEVAKLTYGTESGLYLKCQQRQK